jgi:hypothetical protein
MSFSNAQISKQANVYHEGRVTSRSIVTDSGESKTLGVMLPGSYTFNTGAPEVMEVTQGRCRVRLNGASQWHEYQGGQRFEVPGDSGFTIEVLELLDYICHFEG